MKHDYRILKNMPYEHIQKFWEEDKDDLDNKDKFLHYDDVAVKTWTLYELLPAHKLSSLLEETFSPLNLTMTPAMYMISDANLGMDQIHIDPPPRHCAINIPIRIEEENQFFLMGTDECTETVRSSSGNPKFLYEPEKCAFYNARRPYLFNTMKPHGFANYANTERVVISISIEEPYEEALEKIPKEWF